VHVLDPPDVMDGIHVDPPPDRLALHVADQVTLVPTGVDAVVRIEELHGQDSRILAPQGNDPGIGLGHVVGVLLGVVDHDPLEGAVGLKGDEGRGVLVAGPLGHQEGRAVLSGLGQSRVAEAVVCGHGPPDAGQGDGLGHGQVAGKEVVAPRGAHDAAARLPCSVQGLLKRRRIVRLAVTDRTEVPDMPFA